MRKATYAFNNQERNRTRNNSQVSERAAREIYLKGFGICVLSSQPKAVMTSYNLVNGKHTSEHSGLIEDILRAEFGLTETGSPRKHKKVSGHTLL